jgi:hypothetical protein
MSWRDDLTDEQWEFMQDVNAGLSQSRIRPAGTKVLRGGKWAEPGGPTLRSRSMFPYRSTAMCVDPSEVPEVSERLRKEGLFVEFDRSGRPIIESAKQQSDLAKALGMKTGRDGYGHTDECGRFHNSGRRRTEEMANGRAKVRKAIDTLGVMPEDSAPDAVVDVLREYDIVPNEENTG